MKRILITNYNNYILTCFEEDGSFYEINLTNPKTSILGNIYVGRIEKKIKNIHAYFVSYGTNETAFLSEEDCNNPIILSTPSKKNSLVEGSLVLIQISKEAIKSKDPTVTTNISLKGKYCIIDGNKNTLRFSSKLSKRRRNQIIMEPFLLANPNFGIIIRTSANDLKKESYHRITDEISKLNNEMENLLSKVHALKVHSLVYKAEDPYLTKLRDLDLQKFTKITTDDPIIFNQLSTYFQENFFSHLQLLTYYNDTSYSLNKLNQIDKKLEEIQNKLVNLKNGASLVFEQTEAMNIIDVNSGTSIKGTSREDTFFKINRLAAKEIARQIRLRNLSGIIIIDFINMKEKSNIDNLIMFLIDLIKKDPIKTQFIDITKLGLIELTRKRISPSIKEQLLT